MKLSFITTPLLVSLAHVVNGRMQAGFENSGFTFVGYGMCQDTSPATKYYTSISFKVTPMTDAGCAIKCKSLSIDGLVGFTAFYEGNQPLRCRCQYVYGALDKEDFPDMYVGIGQSPTVRIPDWADPSSVTDPKCYQRNPTIAPTKAPTKSPTKTPTAMSAGAQGDPHFKTWSQKIFDFHGICDLMLLSNQKFEKNLGMDIHIRTEKIRMWSYISALVIRIGKDVLEVVGHNGGSYIVNGILNQGSSDGTMTLSGYPINYTTKNSKQQTFRLYLSTLEAIVIQTWNSFVSVHFENPKNEHFKDSMGLMGSFPDGTWLARDKVTTFDDANTFGQEWQVLEPEAKLFREVKGPQQPLKKCEIPSNLDMRRRLTERSMTQNEAERACIDVKADNVDICIFDVMATNTVLTAGAY